jgi:hypothetical protein
MDVMRPINEVHHVVSRSCSLLGGAPNNKSQGRHSSLLSNMLAGVVPVVSLVNALQASRKMGSLSIATLLLDPVITSGVPSPPTRRRLVGHAAPGWTGPRSRRIPKFSKHSAPESALPAPLQDGDGLAGRHLQNLHLTRLPLGLSCDDVRSDYGHRRHGMACLLSSRRGSDRHSSSCLECWVLTGGWRRHFRLHAGSYLFWESSSISSSGLCRQCLLRYPAFPHCQHTGRPSMWRLAGGGRAPVGALVSSHGLAGGPAAIFAALA